MANFNDARDVRTAWPSGWAVRYPRNLAMLAHACSWLWLLQWGKWEWRWRQDWRAQLPVRANHVKVCPHLGVHNSGHRLYLTIEYSVVLGSWMESQTKWDRHKYMKNDKMDLWIHDGFLDSCTHDGLLDSRWISGFTINRKWLTDGSGSENIQFVIPWDIQVIKKEMFHSRCFFEMISDT